jgi:hypothetical protein
LRHAPRTKRSKRGHQRRPCWSTQRIGKVGWETEVLANGYIECKCYLEHAREKLRSLHTRLMYTLFEYYILHIYQ